MNKQLKRKWIEALRSGEYKQGKNCLYNDKENSYCCLGVLCKIEGKQILPGVYDDNEQVMVDDRNDYDSLFSDHFPLGSKVNRMYLSQLNDCQLASFAEIADYLENELEAI